MVKEKMKYLMRAIRDKIPQGGLEEMWKYSILDMNLNGKGFEIIKKSKKLLEKVEAELENIEKISFN
ncbi:MAG: hypothetical protein B6227_00155 [Fusobacteriia bacterium 4572_74]|nr:MAG: hypothetical protein B6227_00155 [Fusobacteriia bacterium 4572_74]